MKTGFAILVSLCLTAADRQVDPTFLHRYGPEAKEAAADLTTETCHYRPIFSSGDSPVIRGVARFAEIDVDRGGSCKPVQYAAEEQAWVVLDGTGEVSAGTEKAPVRRHDFFYLPPKLPHNIACGSGAPCRVLVMGFKIPAGMAAGAPPKLDVANIADVKTQTVGGHPDSVLYRLLMGDTTSKRDRIAAAHVLTSLFVMEFAPGGTNFPHHHENEEEIYFVLSGKGDMVAGGGADGIEGRHPAKPGDAYFFRLNCTVGFYNSDRRPAHILAVRSLFPRTRVE